MSLPLPLVDRCLFIDNSIWVEGFSSCYRYLEYKALRQRIPKAEKPSLNFGSAIHVALEHRYLHFHNKPVDEVFYQEIATKLTEFFAAHQPPDGDWRTLNWAMEIIRRYNQRYEIEPFNLLGDKLGKPLVEVPFALPLCAYNLQHQTVRMDWDGDPTHLLEDEVGIFYSGRIDLPVHDNGQLFVMDNKTSSYLGQMFWDEMRMTSQQRGYVWAFAKLTGQHPAGYIINGIRTKEPPLYVTGGGSKGKRYSPEEWWQETFQREKFLTDEKHISEWLHNMIDLVEEFFWHWKRDYMPMKTKWCAFYGKCPYYAVCQLIPEDRLSFLNSGDFAKNEWSPLKNI